MSGTENEAVKVLADFIHQEYGRGDEHSPIHSCPCAIAARHYIAALGDAGYRVCKLEQVAKYAPRKGLIYSIASPDDEWPFPDDEPVPVFRVVEESGSGTGDVPDPMDEWGVLQNDLNDIMRVLGLPTGARAMSPHDVFQSVVLPEVHAARRRIVEAEAQRDALREALRTLVDKYPCPMFTDVDAHPGYCVNCGAGPDAKSIADGCWLAPFAVLAAVGVSDKRTTPEDDTGECAHCEHTESMHFDSPSHRPCCIQTCPCPGFAPRGLSLATRSRLIAAAERGLAWRRERIMSARLALFWLRSMLGHRDTWHSYFTCERHGTDIIGGPWVGPYDLDDTDPCSAGESG